MIVRPGLVYPSATAATKTDYDCEVGSLSSRESWEQLKSDGSKALSPFLNEKKVNFFSKNRLQMQKNVL